MGEKMTLEQVRDWHLSKAAFYCDEDYKRMEQRHRAMAKAIDAHLTQPAQAVDVGAILQVIAEMRGFRLNTPPNWNHLDAFADRLTAALPKDSNGAEGVEK